MCDGAHGDFGDFFASCVFSEPRAADFRPASYKKSSQPPNLLISTTLSLFNLLAALALHLWLPSLDHQHHPRYVAYTDRSFRYGSPCLWNQLHSSLRQPRLSPSVSVLPVHASTTSPHSVNSPLSPSITPCLFHLPLSQIFPTIDSLQPQD